MEKFLSVAVLLTLCGTASANVTYHMCYSKSGNDTHPAYGTMMSFGMWQGEGYYDVEGVIFNFKANTAVDADLKAENGSVMSQRNNLGTEFDNFTITTKGGKRTDYACEDLQEDMDSPQSKAAYDSLDGYSQTGYSSELMRNKIYDCTANGILHIGGLILEPVDGLPRAVLSFIPTAHSMFDYHSVTELNDGVISEDGNSKLAFNGKKLTYRSGSQTVVAACEINNEYTANANAGK